MTAPPQEDDGHGNTVIEFEFVVRVTAADPSDKPRIEVLKFADRVRPDYQDFVLGVAIRLRNAVDAALAKLSGAEKRELARITGPSAPDELEVLFKPAVSVHWDEAGDRLVPFRDNGIMARKRVASSVIELLLTLLRAALDRYSNEKERYEPLRADLLRLTWISNPGHVLDVEPGVEPRPQRTSFDELVLPPLADVAPELAGVSAEVDAEKSRLAESLQQSLDAMEGRTFASAEQALAFARGLRRLLTGLDYRIACSVQDEEGGPRCGRPAYLDCTPQKAQPGWALVFKHAGARNEKPHGYFHAVPGLPLTKAPPHGSRKS